MPPVALTIGGSDPSGGAGIQADIKTFHQFGVYGESVLTLLTVQNTHSVLRVETVPVDFVREQLNAVISDIPPGAAKTGALGSPEIVELVAEAARGFAFPLVVDPVMLSKHGARLISRQAEQHLRDKLISCAYLVTPNIPEAEALTRTVIDTEEDMRDAGARLLEMGCHAALIKGGHSLGEPTDVLVTQEEVHLLHGHRIHTPHTHGTGCTYSAAITAALALGCNLLEAATTAKAYIQAAIETAPGLGGGRGPLNHFAPTNRH